MKGLLLSLAVLIGVGCAAPTSSPGDDFLTIGGSLSKEGGGKYVATTAELNPAFNYWGAHLQWSHPVASWKMELSCTFERLDKDDESPCELVFGGGTFAEAKGGYYYWEGKKHWTDWQKTAAWKDGANTLQVKQNGRHLEGFLNGQACGSFDLETEPSRCLVGVFIKSAKGKASRVRFYDFKVRD